MNGQAFLQTTAPSLALPSWQLDRTGQVTSRIFRRSRRSVIVWSGWQSK
jgi:hypothetical protein